MGNCASSSCTKIAPKIRIVQAAVGRVVDVEVPLLQSSVKVGELMLEFPPGHFVAQFNKADLLASTGKRAAPLGADADAKPGGAVYVLLPMPRLHTRISPQELLSFAKLLHRHDQQLITEAAHRPSKVHGLFTAGRARVAPLIAAADLERECKDANLQYSGAAAKQQSEEEESVIPYRDSSSFIMTSSCHGHIGVVKKPWAPKLQTIMEISS